MIFIQLLPSFLLIITFLCCMCSIGCCVIERAKDENRNLTIDYIMYVSLLISCCCVVIQIGIPLFLIYNFMNFFGLI